MWIASRVWKSIQTSVSCKKEWYTLVWGDPLHRGNKDIVHSCAFAMHDSCIWCVHEHVSMNVCTVWLQEGIFLLKSRWLYIRVRHIHRAWRDELFGYMLVKDWMFNGYVLYAVTFLRWFEKVKGKFWKINSMSLMLNTPRALDQNKTKKKEKDEKFRTDSCWKWILVSLSFCFFSPLNNTWLPLPRRSCFSWHFLAYFSACKQDDRIFKVTGFGEILNKGVTSPFLQLIRFWWLTE